MVFDYERAAMNNEELPDGLELLDQLHFLALRTLYAHYYDGRIDRDLARREKGKLEYQRDKLERKLHVRERMVARSVEMLKNVEHAANGYAKERTLENADRLYQAIYGLEVSE